VAQSQPIPRRAEDGGKDESNAQKKHPLI
jgi:hypothetical protein